MDDKTALAIASESEIKINPYLKFCLYGEAGHAKTVTLARIAQEALGEKGIIIAADNGWISLRNHGDLVDNFLIRQYDGLSQLRAYCEAMEEGVTIGDIDFSQYKVLQPDTISQMQEEYTDRLLELVKDYSGAASRPQPVVDGKNQKEVEELGITVPGLADYQTTKVKLRPVIKDLIKAPVHVLMASHMREPSFMDEQKGKLLRRPHVPDATWQIIKREVDLIGLIEMKKGVPEIDFTPGPRTAAKSRLGNLNNRRVSVEELITSLAEWNKEMEQYR